VREFFLYWGFPFSICFARVYAQRDEAVSYRGAGCVDGVYHRLFNSVGDAGLRDCVVSVIFAKQPERYAEPAGVGIVSLLGWFSFVVYVTAILARGLVVLVLSAWPVDAYLSVYWRGHCYA